MWEEEEEKDVSIFSPSHPDQSVSRGLEREQYENSMLNCCLIIVSRISFQLLIKHPCMQLIKWDFLLIQLAADVSSLPSPQYRK